MRNLTDLSWAMFEETGSINSYLSYKENRDLDKKQKKKDNSCEIKEDNRMF